jgi:hypothetical protein
VLISGATLLIILYDRSTRIRIGFKIEERPGPLILPGRSPLPYAVFSLENRGRSKINAPDFYLVVPHNNARIAWPNSPYIGLSLWGEWLPDSRPIEAVYPMADLARKLTDQGQVLTGYIVCVLEHGAGEAYRKEFTIRDLPKWAAKPSWEEGGELTA